MPEFPGYTGDAKPALPVIKITAVTHRKNPIMQFKKSSKNDEGRQRNAALLAFSAFSELKHVFLVDEDVDIFDMSDVMWAMTTRFQADVDMIPIPGCHCHVLDPSNDHALDPSIRVHGIACKAISTARFRSIRKRTLSEAVSWKSTKINGQKSSHSKKIMRRK